jgi:anaerobic selenocysteine-containing dehydrogenase
MAMTDRAGDTPVDAVQDTVHYRTCPLCEATCGLEITMRGDAVKRIRGDRDDVFSHGFICPKGSTLKQFHDDPDRLRAPLVRRDGGHVEVTWEEAYAEVERLLTPVLEEHGRDACAIYLGNPSVHNHAPTLYGRPLIMALGTRNIFSASTVDQMPKHVSAGLMFGDGLTIPVPDLDRTDYLLMLGANPWESNGSLCTAPDFPGRLEAIQARGGRFVVVDPRRTKTAEHADEHLPIRPGTDALWLCALLNVLYGDGLVDAGDLADHVAGLEEVGTLVAPFTPEAVERLCGIPAAVTRRIAHELAAAPTAAVYGRIGTHTVAFGTLASWAVDALNTVTGNLDRPGGAMFPYPAHGSPHPETPGGRGFDIGRHRSRVKGHPEVRREFPVATLADEIETPGEGQVRALVTVAGNPALSTPDSGRLDAALATLECMVSVDPYLNETTRHAHVILPPPSPLAKSHYDLGFAGLSIRNVANWSAPITEPEGPLESEILARLALIASGQGASADPTIIDDLLIGAMLGRATREGGPLAGRDPEELKAQLTGDRPEDRALDAMLRTGPYGDLFGQNPDGLSLATLQANPHGVDLGPLTPQIPAALRTPSAKVELAPALVAADLSRLADHLDTTLASLDDGQLLLVGRRHLRSNNSWMHNLEVLVKGKPRCTLQIHPTDAARLGLDDGKPARITSRVGEVEAPVEVTDEVMAGVVSLPHGWGHSTPGARMQVAERYAGVNTNILTDGEALDPLSGNAVLNGIPVAVAPA